MTAHEIHALSGAYAVDALDDAERVRFEEHLEVCAECRDEVTSLQESSALLGELTTTAPPAALRNRLMSDIKTLRPLPPITPDRTVVSIRSRRRFARALPTGRGLAVAAALLGVVGIGAVTVINQDDTTSIEALPPIERVLAATDAKTVTVDLPGPATAKLVRSVSERKAVLVTTGMPEAPTGRVYELWLRNSAGDMVPAGLMTKGGDQRVLFKGDASLANAAAVTVEPAGGSPAPTSAPIVMFDFERAT